MKAETIAFVSELVRRNAGVASLLDADFAMLNRRLAAHYGVDGVNGSAARTLSHQTVPLPRSVLTALAHLWKPFISAFMTCW